MPDDAAQRFEVRRDVGPPIRFTGWRLGHAFTSPDRGGPDYSGSPGRWRELALYRTRGGAYVCERIGKTIWEGEHNRYDAAAVADLAGVKAFFGWDRLVHDLFEAADLLEEVAEEVE